MIEQAFSGRKGNVKASGEIIRYMRQQYKLRGLLGKRYREIIINGVEEIYGVKISKRLAGEIFKGVNIGREEEEFSYAGESEKWLKSAHTGGDVRGIRDRSVQRSPILMEEETGVFLIHHGGQILFERYMGYYYGLERQLLIQILQGHINIEQSKGICFSSMRVFSDQLSCVLSEQRSVADKLSAGENIMSLYMRNKELVGDGPDRGEIFYFDPHTKHYTGQLKILKGWCGSLHRPSKVLNLDCFHTASGRICFIKHYSAYYDLRERFFMSLYEFDTLFKEENRIGRTFIIDRAVYSEGCPAKFEKDYLITWEKGYKGDGWEEGKDFIIFEREKSKL